MKLEREMEILELKSIFEMKIHWSDFTEVWSADIGSVNLKIHQKKWSGLKNKENTKAKNTNRDTTICGTILSVLKYV